MDGGQEAAQEEVKGTDEQKQEEEAVELKEGMRVRLHSLLSAVELNGVLGTLRRFNTEKGRWIVRVDNLKDFKLLKGDNLSPLARSSTSEQSFLLEVLSEDAILLMCSFLPGSDLVALSGSAKSLHERGRNSVALWSSLCQSLLGETLVKLHEVVWRADQWPDQAQFWQKLFEAAYRGAGFVYANDFTKKFEMSLPCIAKAMKDGEESQRSGPITVSCGDLEREMEYLLAASGHTAVALGEVLVVIGGWRPRVLEEDLFVTIVKIAEGSFVKPSLGLGSARPQRRLRHASCIVKRLPPQDEATASSSSSFSQSSVLVLGGCNDRTQEPCPGLNTLLFMDITKDDCSEIVWREEKAEGSAPKSLWHHSCGAFEKGSKVIVFGGDMLDSDTEYQHMADRSYASHVYILDVAMRRWERVETKGRLPGWRSLHVGVSYASLADNSERFVIMGGTKDHCDIFGAGHPASMTGYALNLTTMKWQRGRSQGNNFEPMPRMRFAAERYGRHLLVFGGFGDRPILENEIFLQLNLMTLEWSNVTIAGTPESYPAAPAAVLAGGCLMGGVALNARLRGGGVIPVPKFDAVCLSPPLLVD